MLIYNDIYTWEGWGGRLRLASGLCRLWIFDRQIEGAKGIKHLKPVIVIATDVPESKMSIKSCAGNIATKITDTFKIDPQRMMYLEYYPATTYGKEDQYEIVEKYELVEFAWHDGKAIHPKWRTISPPMLDILKELRKEKGSPAY
jgi:hypothetical protein